MSIPIIHRRTASRYRILFISLLLTFIISISLLTSSDLITAFGYEIIESIAIVVLMSHALLLFIFLISRQVIEIGQIHLLDNGFEIKMNSGESNFFLKSITRLKLTIEGYRGQKNEDKHAKPEDGLGNFLVIQTMDRTLIYEFLLSSQNEMIYLIEYFNKNAYAGMIDIEYNFET